MREMRERDRERERERERTKCFCQRFFKHLLSTMNEMYSDSYCHYINSFSLANYTKMLMIVSMNGVFMAVAEAAWDNQAALYFIVL